jgi:hypothetical protein
MAVDCRIHQPDQVAYEGGLAASRKAHENEDLPFLNLEGDIPQAYYEACIFLYLFLGFVFKVGF